MRNCNCAGQTCGCLVTGGAGIQITGIGSATNPFVVTNIASDLSHSLAVSDTTTLDLVMLGSGTNADPFILQGNVTLKMQQLSDVNDPQGGPVAGESPIYVGSGGSAHWEFQQVFRAFTTAARPAATAVTIGASYFDTTLGKPGWSNGTVWKDAAGVTI